LNRTEKTQNISGLQKKLDGSKAVVLTNFRGMKVGQLTNLRQRLREEKVAYQVVKNTLVKRAAKGTDLEKLSDYFEGPTGIAISYGEPIALAKALAEFQKTLPSFEVKAGLIEGRVASPPEIKALATMPPREVIMAQLLGGIQGPATQLAGAIQSAIQQVLGTVQARIDQLSQQTVEPAAE
jgi:large subunit ribosomal protein L10